MESIRGIISMIKNPAVFSGLITAVVTIFTFYKTFTLNEKNKLLKIKEDEYMYFLSGLVSYHRYFSYGLEPNFDIGAALDANLQRMYLIASVETVNCINDFLVFLINSKRIEAENEGIINNVSSQEQQDKLYAKIVNSMRKDLYGYRYLPKVFQKKKGFERLSLLHFM